MAKREDGTDRFTKATPAFINERGKNFFDIPVPVVQSGEAGFRDGRRMLEQLRVLAHRVEDGQFGTPGGYRCSVARMLYFMGGDFFNNVVMSRRFETDYTTGLINGFWGSIARLLGEERKEDLATFDKKDADYQRMMKLATGRAAPTEAR